MDVLVFGAGRLGSLVGGLLAREHAVTLLGRDPHVSTVRDEGLVITGAVEDAVSPDAVTSLDEVSSDSIPALDLAVVTVKAFDTAEAARALAGADLGAVLSLQNGMGNEETLAAHLDVPVLAGTATYGARLREAGVVECTGMGEVTIGPHADAPLDLAERVGGAFRRAGIETAVVAEMRPRLWRKLAVNAGINPVTALARVENGALREEPLRTVAVRTATETAAVAREAGIDLSDATASEAVLEVAETTAANVSSMHGDVKAGRRTEIDAINGYVLDRAEDDVPVNETLVSLLRAWERKRGLR